MYLILHAMPAALPCLSDLLMHAGIPQHMGGNPQLQMNGTTASAIHALPTSLPGQSTTSALTQKLAGVEDQDQRRTMLGDLHNCC